MSFVVYFKYKIRITAHHQAYTSDVGEAFRPVVPTWAVNATCAETPTLPLQQELARCDRPAHAADGVAFGYVGCEVALKANAASEAGATNAEVARVTAHTATFQLLASILAPFLAIHTQGSPPRPPSRPMR